MRAHRRVVRGRCDEGEADQRQREIHAERQQEKPLHRRGRIAFAQQTPAGQRHAGEGGREARSHCAQRRYSGERAQSPTPVAAIGSPREGEVGEPEQHQQLKRRQETPLRSLPRERERRADRGDHQHERQCRARQTAPEERGHGQRRQRGKHRVQRQLGARVPLTVEISESDCQQPGPHRAVLVAGPPEPRPDRATRPVRAEHVDGLGVPLVVKRQVVAETTHDHPTRTDNEQECACERGRDPPPEPVRGAVGGCWRGLGHGGGDGADSALRPWKIFAKQDASVSSQGVPNDTPS